MSQTVCPYNVKFAQALPDDSPFAPRGAIAGKDARTLAREILATDPDTYRAAFRSSRMKRSEAAGDEAERRRGARQRR
jgi:epoxyqueuosine reductase